MNEGVAIECSVLYLLSSREVFCWVRCSVRVGYCISHVAAVMKCSTGIVRVSGGANEVVAIEYSS